MPRGYRCIVIAAVGWLELCGAQRPAKQPQASKSTNQPTAAPQPTAPPTPPPEAPYRPYAQRYSDACYSAQNHDTADLCAQWRAAIAAEKAADEAHFATIAAIVGTVLSLATVFGLIVTIWQTHGALGEARRGNRLNLLFERRSRREARKAEADQAKALEIAAKNADAAAAQVEVAREIGQKQIRAYVSFGVCKIQYMELTGLLAVSINIINTGQSPARSVVADVKVELARKGPMKTLHRRAPWPDIPVGDKGIYTVEFLKDKMSLDEINEYFGAIIHLSLSGMDVFGNRFSGYIESLFIVRGQAGEAMGSVDNWTLSQRTMITSKKNCLYEGEPGPEIDPEWGVDRT